jgi:hypothetical protein
MNDRLWTVINCVLSLEVTKGHLKWKVSDVSRMTKVDRNWIYYHLGKSKTEIFDYCLEKCAEEFYGLSESRMQMVREGRLKECLVLTRAMFQENPEFMIFYYKWRMRKGILQQKLIELEVRYRKKLQAIFPKWTNDDIISFQALIQGAVMSPVLSESTFKRAIEMIRTPRV